MAAVVLGKQLHAPFRDQKEVRPGRTVHRAQRSRFGGVECRRLHEALSLWDGSHLGPMVGRGCSSEARRELGFAILGDAAGLRQLRPRVPKLLATRLLRLGARLPVEPPHVPDGLADRLPQRRRELPDAVGTLDRTPPPLRPVRQRHDRPPPPLYLLREARYLPHRTLPSSTS